MEPFNKSQDPFDHLKTYKTLMLVHDYLDRVMGRAFLVTLKGLTRKWFNNLQQNNIDSFFKLNQSFTSHFIGGRHYCRLETDQLNVKQSKGESLRDYVSYFNQEVMQIDDVDEKVVLIAFMGRLLPMKFLFFLSKSPPKNMADLMLRAKKHMNTEDVMVARRD